MGPFGAIAQLGERLPCTQEVNGSIPFSSTNFSDVTLRDWLIAAATGAGMHFGLAKLTSFVNRWN